MVGSPWSATVCSFPPDGEFPVTLKTSRTDTEGREEVWEGSENALAFITSVVSFAFRVHDALNFVSLPVLSVLLRAVRSLDGSSAIFGAL